MKVKRWLLACVVAMLAMLGLGSAAVATPGAVANSGDIQVQAVWIYEYVSFPTGTRDLDVDCPSGAKVVTGYGTWAYGQTGSVSSVAGSALDADTWRVTFYNAGSQHFAYLQAHAVCI